MEKWVKRANCYSVSREIKIFTTNSIYSISCTELGEEIDSFTAWKLDDNKASISKDKETFDYYVLSKHVFSGLLVGCAKQYKANLVK